MTVLLMHFLNQGDGNSVERIRWPLP